METINTNNQDINKQGKADNQDVSAVSDMHAPTAKTSATPKATAKASTDKTTAKASTAKVGTAKKPTTTVKKPTTTVKASTAKSTTTKTAVKQPASTAKKATTAKASTAKTTTAKTTTAKTTAKKASTKKGTTTATRRRSPLKNKTANDIEDDYGLKLFFQPIFIASENRVFGYECLLRIVDKDLGVITPNAFLGVAQKNITLMKGLEDWSMSELFRIAKLFRDNHKFIDMISLNIDTNNFFRKDFYERISKYFDKFNENIYIELKEDAFFSEDTLVSETMYKLRRAGIKIAVDDFTANFLTFDWEQDLPFDMIKIDRAFIDRFMISPKARQIIEKIIAFAKAHNVDIVAVGVENAEQERELINMGCNMMQGYYYAKPLQIKRLLEDR